MFVVLVYPSLQVESQVLGRWCTQMQIHSFFFAGIPIPLPLAGVLHRFTCLFRLKTLLEDVVCLASWQRAPESVSSLEKGLSNVRVLDNN